MQDIFFYIFAGLTLLCGLLVVANPLSRNPVTSAMFLVLCIVSMAGMFVLLEAFFLGAVQILVYAGAVMVLFLFVIMLLDIKAEELRKLKAVSVGLGAAAVAAIAGFLIYRIVVAHPGKDLPPAEVQGATQALGTILFTKYLLPFEILSVLLLVAMIGAILLSKRDLR